MDYEVKEYEERYFIGIEYEGGVSLDNAPKIGQLWSVFLAEDLKLLDQEKLHDKFIGLECYTPDFKETRMYDYFALVETKELIKQPGFVSKKLPKGKYISFTIQYDTISDEIRNVYQYMAVNDIHYHVGFDIEDFITGEDYTKNGAILKFSLLLEE